LRVRDVEVKGKYGQPHSVTVKASSLFDAALQGLNDWSRLWWWDRESIITVRSDGQVWQVRSQRVLDWEFKRRNLERQREKA